MNNINFEKEMILNAERGEDVRDAFISACKKIVGGQLPETTMSDIDKVLTVDSFGKWGVSDWQT